MIHVVSLSGGTASAVAADRVLERHGRESTRLWFADTSWEHPDLYRFLDDLEARWGMPIERHQDGRNPLEVAEQKSIIPNQRRAPCSNVLKVEPFRRYIETLPRPVTIHLGLDWTEIHRADRPKEEYEALEGVTVDLPLLWEPIARPPHRLTTEAWGIRTPALYDQGFPHNNCGGSCVKQGIDGWVRLLSVDPDRYELVRSWEEAQRAKGGARANYAILRDRRGGDLQPLTLTELKARAGGRQPVLFDPSNEDTIACFCDVL